MIGWYHKEHYTFILLDSSNLLKKWKTLLEGLSIEFLVNTLIRLYKIKTSMK
jgi:hypothetical protein